MSPACDWLVRDATVYDGTGAPGRRADVAIAGDRIAAVGPDASGLRAAREIAAAGLALAPGFIDVHTHDDFAVLLHPEMDFKVRGGVTTCVVGNCGMGAAPFHAASLMARAFHPDATLPEWQGYPGYLEQVEAAPSSVNVGVLVGHGSLRLEAMGGERRPPAPSELARMRGWLREGLGAGALGLSTGLIYDPGRFADTDEIVALAEEVAEFGGLYATHMRDEGLGLLDSVREAIEIGERAGVPVQISHHKASGRPAWGLVRDSLRLIEEAQARGLRVDADQYPYTAGSTVLQALAANRAFDASARGGIGSLPGSDVVVASAPAMPEWEGRTVADYARERGLPEQEAAEELVAREPRTTIVLHSMCEEDVRTVMRHPSTMIGSDGIPTLSGKPHPRLFGTFARVLGHYARDEGVLSLADAVHRMTGKAAAKFGLEDRGVVRSGAFADLVLFAPEEIRDRGTYEEPHAYPAGISAVFVNGVRVVSEDGHTHARPGRVLRRG